MRPGSLRLRLLVGAGAFIFAAVAVSAIGLAYLFRSHVESWVDAELSADLDQVIAGIDRNGEGGIAVVKQPSDPRFEQPLSGLYWQVVVEPGGRVLRSRSLWDFAIALPPEAAVDDIVHHHLSAGPAGQTLYLIQRRIALPARLDAHTVRVAVALNDAEVRAAVWRFAAALSPFLLVLGALLTAAAWVQVAYGLRPLAAMRAKLAAIGSGARRRLGGGFPDEVQPLAREIDALLDARERQVDTARARAADLAHGLKTPLQVLASDADQLKAKGEDEIAGEIDTVASAMQRLVERQLARARVGSADANAAAVIGDAVASVVRVVERTPKGRDLAWRVEVPAGVSARIDAGDLTEALGNLIENAARHARAEVAITAAPEDGRLAIRVKDDGSGIPPEREADALRRGTRLDTSGPGAGLGLAIAADIAEAWGGTLSFERPDGGFCVCLRIPSAPPGRA
jgi:signal transduction histidine kinase